MTQYDPTLFEGAAAHYRYGRPPYSPQLEAVLGEELGLDGSGRLLDGGCGPGILTIRLVHLFEEATGLDPDAAMLAEGRRVAGGRGIRNIRWVHARAEDLPEAAPGPYRLVTFGQSLHWTDEHRVMETVYDLLEPDGALVMVVHTVEGRPEPPSPGPPRIPHAEIRALVEKYLGTTQRAGQGVSPVRTHRFEEVLVLTRFGAPRSDLRPRHPGPGARQRERAVGLLLVLLLGAAPVRRPSGRLRRRGAGTAGGTLGRGSVLGLAGRHRGDPRAEARR